MSPWTAGRPQACSSIKEIRALFFCFHWEDKKTQCSSLFKGPMSDFQVKGGRGGVVEIFLFVIGCARRRPLEV